MGAGRDRFERGEAAPDKPDRADREVVRALSHPLRVRILETLRGRTASPSQLSAEMGQSRAVISYHAKTLVGCGCLEIVAGVPGDDSAEQHLAIAGDCFVGSGHWRRVGDSLRCDVTEATMRTLMDKASRAIGLAAPDTRKQRARQEDGPAD